MNSLFIYLFQSFISFACLYLVYFIFLRNETFFKINRFYLLSSAIVSVLLPFSKFQFSETVSQNTVLYVLETIDVANKEIESIASVNFGLSKILLTIYIIGVAFYTIKFLLQIMKIIWMIKKFQIVKSNGLKIVFTNSEYLNFSFFNVIFLNSLNIDDEDIKKIISHELIHIRQKHSFDSIFIELLTIINWFNPIIWLYKNSIKEVHEYLADDCVIKKHNIYSYQELLLSKVVGVNFNLLTNFFNKSLITRRVIMMTKPRSSSMAKFKVLFAIPMIFMLIFAFSIAPNELYSQENQKKVNYSKQKKVDAKTEKGDVFEKVDVMPEFVNGKDAMIKFIAQNVKYPESERKKGVQGKIYVSFVVNKHGKITDVKIARGVSPAIDREAIRVVKSMPNWKPGENNEKPVKVKFTIPISFKLSE